MRRGILALLGLLLFLPAGAQLRVVTWNISNYNGGRVSDIQRVVFGDFDGRSMSPDALVVQEVLNSAAQTSLLNALNTAPESSGTWAAAPFTNGNDTDNAFFYRTDRLQLLASTIVGVGGASPLPPRDTKRYDVRLLGYAVRQPKIAIYSSHMKAGTSSDDKARRLAEASLIRQDAQNLVGFDGFLVTGDLNLYTSTEDAYVKLTGSEANNAGRVFDPIASPGSWNGSAAFRFLHTQDPATSAGMNSRFDFILLNQRLVDGIGFDYIGAPTTPYSTVTWNDPAHSYRAWGNDGTSFNAPLTVAGNAMVGATIAQAIRDAATTAGGHVPVLLDLRVPAEAAVSPSVLDFGTVVQGTAASRTVTVTNATSTTLWRTGIAPLLYTFSASSGFNAPSGTHTAGAGGSTHTVTMSTAVPGDYSGTVLVQPTDPDDPVRSINVSGRVVPDELFGSSYTVSLGTPLAGGLPQLSASDNVYATSEVVFFARSGVVGGEVLLDAVSPVSGFSTLSVFVESGANFLVRQTMEVYNFTSNAWVLVNERALTKGDHSVTVALTNPMEYMNPGTRQLRLRLRTYPGLAMPDGGTFVYRLDKVAWTLR